MQTIMVYKGCFVLELTRKIVLCKEPTNMKGKLRSSFKEKHGPYVLLAKYHRKAKILQTKM
jgi:hypothetical protein